MVSQRQEDARLHINIPSRCKRPYTATGSLSLNRFLPLSDKELLLHAGAKQGARDKREEVNSRDEERREGGREGGERKWKDEEGGKEGNEGLESRALRKTETMETEADGGTEGNGQSEQRGGNNELTKAELCLRPELGGITDLQTRGENSEEHGGRTERPTETIIRHCKESCRCSTQLDATSTELVQEWQQADGGSLSEEQRV